MYDNNRKDGDKRDWNRKQEETANITEMEEEIDFALAVHHESELNQFTREASCAALDTCCTSSVTGKQWLEMFMDSLDEKLWLKLKGPMPSNRLFNFGNNGRLRSLGT